MVARPHLLITGIADGLGASVAGAFAGAGYDVLGLSRSDGITSQFTRLVSEAGGAYTHLRCDIADPAQVTAALQPHAEHIAVLIHNAHRLLVKPGSETSLEDFEALWRVTCFGAMAVAGQVLPSMLARGAGSLIFTGATAARRAGARFAAFASAKFALRGLAQALARECGPKGVHVAHVVLDGLIDEPQSESRFGPAQSVRMDPGAIARTYLDLVRQPRSAWTHELDLRPFDERF